MLIPTSCTKCRHDFEVDSSFVGTMRKCPVCGNRFLFDQSAAEREGTQLDDLRGQKVACSSCLRTFIPIAARQKDEHIDCQFCDARVHIPSGELLYQKIRGIEKVIRKSLLHGDANDVILSRIARYSPELPGGMETNCRILKHQVERLPFLRKEAIQYGGRETQFLRPRTNCDHCQQSAPDHTLEIRWQLKQLSNGSVVQQIFLGLLLGRLGLALPKKVHISERIGIYFLCEQCRIPYSGWHRFFRTPSNEGYKAVSVKDCTLEETESGSQIRYT